MRLVIKNNLNYMFTLIIINNSNTTKGGNNGNNCTYRCHLYMHACFTIFLPYKEDENFRPNWISLHNLPKKKKKNISNTTAKKVSTNHYFVHVRHSRILFAFRFAEYIVRILFKLQFFLAFGAEKLKKQTLAKSKTIQMK